MNAEWKKKWVDALRSGEYEQGRSSLAINEEDGLKHCCLGVLCDLVVKEHEGFEWVKTSELFPNVKDPSGKLAENILPKTMAGIVGLESCVPEVFYDYSKTSVTSLNDDTRLSFTEIASLIEGQL